MVDFRYEIDKNFDYTIEEKGNTFIALRKIKWGDRDEFRLDLRKYISTEEGERMGKGLSFITDEGPSELINVLLDNNYGDPDIIGNTIVKKRKDILDSIMRISMGDESSDESNDGELYSARSLFDE